MASKLDKTNVKYRKVEEGPSKKTGIEQLEQMKTKKRESREVINNIDDTISQNVKSQKSTKSNNGNISIQELSDNINKNLTVFKSRNSIEAKNSSTKVDEYKIDRADKKKATNANSTSKNTNLKLNIKNDKTANSIKNEVVAKNTKIDDDKPIPTSLFVREEGKKEVTDISESSKVRRQIKRRSNRKKRQEKINELKERIKKINVKKVIAIGIISVVVIGFSIAISMTMIQETIIDEGTNYTKEEIKNIVINNILDHNSVYLFLKYRYSEQEKIPFVEYIDVSWKDAKTVKIKVYDKSIIACTNYMNEYIYFDKDGMVVETSSKKQANIQYVTGLNFSEVKLNDKIKVADDEIFDTILSVTQQIAKYDLDIKEINFDEKDNLTLYTDKITILMGNHETYDEQLAKLRNMLEEASKKNLKGILHMENYVEGQNRIIFNKID